MEILGVPENDIFMVSGCLRRVLEVFFYVFGAQLRKANDLLRVCEPLRILLWLAALKGSPFLCLFLEIWKYLAGAPVAVIVAVCGVTVLWCFIHSGIHILQSL